MCKLQDLVFSLDADGMVYNLPVKYRDEENSAIKVCMQPFKEDLKLKVLDTTRLDFSLIQTTTGEVVCSQDHVHFTVVMNFLNSY